MAIYQHKPVRIEAVEWTGEAFADTPEWLAVALASAPCDLGAVRVNGAQAYIVRSDGHRYALMPGDHLGRHPNGCLYVMPTWHMTDYEPVPS